MARTGATPPTDPNADPLLSTSVPSEESEGEKAVDYMADAPKPRPYAEAVSDEHRTVLEENGIQFPQKESRKK